MNDLQQERVNEQMNTILVYASHADISVWTHTLTADI